MMTEDLMLAALQASTDQYGAGLRDLAEGNPDLARIARAMATMIRQQPTHVDGSAVIAAAQAAHGAMAMVREGGGELGAQGVVNLIFLAGMAMNAADAPEMPGATHGQRERVPAPPTGPSEEEEALTEIPDAAVRAALAERARLLVDRPDPMVLSDETLFRRVLEAALPHLGIVRQDLHLSPWRQGRHEPRHLYAQIGPEASDDDPIVGTLDTPEAAAEACLAHNERLAGRPAWEVARYLCSVTEGHNREAVAASAWSLADALTSAKADRERLISILIGGSEGYAS